MSQTPLPANPPWRWAVDLLRDARWLTRERLLLTGCIFAAVSAYLLYWGVGYYTANGLIAASGEPLGQDFLNYFAGAQVAASGQAPLAYDHHWFLDYERRLVGPVTPRFYAYPPILMLLTLPLAFLSYVPALVVWTLLGTALTVVLLGRLVGWQAAAVATVGAPAAFLNLLLANNGFFTGGLLGGGLMLLDRHPVIAGICFGCLSYKPHLAVLLPFALAAGRRWRTMLAAAITVAALATASLIMFGTPTWSAFMHQMRFNRALLETDPQLWHWMLTVFSATRQFGGPILLAYAFQLASSGLALAAVVLVWRRPGATEVKAAALLVATLLATPYGQNYDAVIVIFAAAWLGREGTRTGFFPWERQAIVALLVFPIVTVPLALLANIPLAPVLLWFVLVLLVRRALCSPVALHSGGLAPARAAVQHQPTVVNRSSARAEMDP
ncbi:MAG TPA: glycosyltransferase family 87 protein [Stellaceae bacterium]|nr:glycosyltransferase family 87 protein [Stellaceae bacterium]